MPRPDFCNRTRREFLWQGGAGFGPVAVVGETVEGPTA